MKTQDLINAFGDIDEEYFAEGGIASAIEGSVDLLGSKPETIRIYKEPLRVRVRRYAVTAAAIICALAVGVAAGAHFGTARIEPVPNSPNSSNSSGSVSITQQKPLTPVFNENYEYLTLAEIREHMSETVLSNEKLSIERAFPGDGEAMPIYKLSPYNNNFDDAAGFAKHLFGDDLPLEDPYVAYGYKGTNSDTNFIGFFNKNNNPQYGDSRLIYHETGYMFLDSVNSVTEPYRHHVNFTTKRHYKLYMGDDPGNEGYVMNNGQYWSVADAIAYAEYFADTYFSPLEKNEFTFNVTDIRVKSLGNGNFGYVADMQRVDKNGNLYDNHSIYANRQAWFDTYKTFRYNTDCWLAEGNPWLVESNVEIFFIEKEIPHTFSKSPAPYSGKALTSGEKLLSLQSAIDIVSAAPRPTSDKAPIINDKQKLEFATAELEYYNVSVGCPEYTGSDYVGPLSDSYEEMRDTDYAQIRPYWAFTLSTNYCENTDQDNAKFFYPNHYSLYLVDAVTGELHII